MARLSALATIFVLQAGSLLAQDTLQSRPIVLPLFVISGSTLRNFDIDDARADMEAAQSAGRQREQPTHSMFVVKQHIGLAGGYDSGVAHTSIGYYVTVAEWGRWNYGVPGVEIGFGRYPEYDPSVQRVMGHDEVALFVSLASVHYRLKYLRTFGVTWYLNLEQVYDLRHNFSGSQFGFSFSDK